MPSKSPKISALWMRGPADELAVSEGCTFDEAAGRHACDFIERYCRQSKGRWGGQPLTLLTWQRDFLMRLFGWKKADGTRRYRRAYLEVAKKNGKSTLLSAVALYLLLADGEEGPEVYNNACDRNQARIIFDETAKMIASSPQLRARAEVVKSANRVICPSNNGVIRANSADAPNKDGLNPSATIFDELHRQPNRDLWEVFEYAGAARDQPLILSITTAGEDTTGVWYEQREYSEKVNAGEIADTSHLGVVYRALDEDDLDDPATWRKANPSLGETIKESEFKRELEEAKQSPAQLANFRRLRLNIVTREAAKFFPLGRWEACNVALAKPEVLRGLPCYVGLDLSSVDDLTALVAIFGTAAGGFDVLAKFYLPGDNVEELGRRHKVRYDVWERAGYLTLTPGEVVDYEFIRQDLLDLAADHDIRKVMVDPYQAQRLASQLADSDGLPVEYLRQGFLSLSAPTKELLRLVIAGKLRHGGNPVLSWMAGNAVAESDAAQNIKLSKKKSRLKIDGMSALVNAVAAATGDGGDEGGSVYESRGLIFL